MKIKVIEENCICCGACEACCEDVFVVDGVCKLKTTEIPADKEQEVRDAMDTCPVQAIVEDAE